MKRVYLDNAATTPLDEDVQQAMIKVMNEDFGNPSSVHAHGRKAKTLVEDSRKQVAQCLNASIGEIYFTSGATESNNTAILCAVRDLGVKRIITSPTEHPCVINSIAAVKNHFSIDVEQLSVDNRGNVNMNELANALKSSDEKTLVSLMLGNNEVGTMLDFETCSQICHDNEALFHTDSVQAIGKKDIDLSTTYVSFLSATGHKIFGPKGTGILYVNSNNIISPFINGGGQERNLRSGTENTYGIVGFATAFEKMHFNRKAYDAKLTSLRNHMKAGLMKEVPEATFNGNQDELTLSHILSVSVPQSEKAEMIIFNLDINGISASAGSACSSGAVQSSHVLAALGVTADRKTIRFSFSPHNTFEELDYAIEQFKKALA